MLALTPSAAQAVRELLASAPVDDDGGIRISLPETTNDSAALQITLVDGPEIADESVDEEGVHVFLEPELAEFLDDKVLDTDLGALPRSAAERGSRHEKRPVDLGRLTTATASARRCRPLAAA